MNLIKKNDIQDYYDTWRKFLSMVGQWPYQRLRDKIFCMGVMIIWCISILAVQIAQIYICETTMCILETLPIHLVPWICLMKLLTCHFNNRNIKHLIEQLHADWKILENKEELEIMKRYTMNGRRYALIYACKRYSDSAYLFVGGLLFGAIAFVPVILNAVIPLNESRPLMLPCPAYYFVDETKYFYYLFFHLEFGFLLCIVICVAHDYTFLICVEHACSLFAIVGFRFEYFLYKRNITDKSLINYSDSVYVENIALSIQVHQKALQLAARIENIFSLSFVIQMLIIVISMSCSLMKLSAELKGDVKEVMRYVAFVSSQLFHLLVLSFQGQRLINHSLETHAKIYHGSWYNIPVKSQKLLLFAMRKSMKMISLSAGKIYIFSLENFTLVIKTSVSYFTVLASFS